MTVDQHRSAPSTQPGVRRVMLDRLVGEPGRATSVVRYALHSGFPAHAHPGGEEILVQSATVSDDGGDCGPGWYLRNPPGSSHQPSSANGARTFVKLWQMPACDTRTGPTNTTYDASWGIYGTQQVCVLHRTHHDQVQLVRFAPVERLRPDASAGVESLVIERQWAGGATVLAPLGWQRLAPGGASELRAGAFGTMVYMKTSHPAELVI